jgi:hypothetical protein
MAEYVKKEVCRCVNCGNEAEMVFTCSLAEPEPSAAKADSPEPAASGSRKVKATGTCAHCGNEADMWIEI